MNVATILFSCRTIRNSRDLEYKSIQCVLFYYCHYLITIIIAIIIYYSLTPEQSLMQAALRHVLRDFSRQMAERIERTTNGFTSSADDYDDGALTSSLFSSIGRSRVSGSSAAVVNHDDHEHGSLTSGLDFDFDQCIALQQLLVSLLSGSKTFLHWNTMTFRYKDMHILTSSMHAYILIFSMHVLKNAYRPTDCQHDRAAVLTVMEIWFYTVSSNFLSMTF